MRLTASYINKEGTIMEWLTAQPNTAASRLSVLPIHQLSKILFTCLKLNNEIKLATIDAAQCRVKKKRQWKRNTEIYKVELNMKAPGIKKKDPDTQSTVLGSWAYKVKNWSHWRVRHEVACLPLSHSSYKVSIRLGYFPVFRNQENISRRGQNSP